MEKKKIIGYTTGVFDMFHIGHLKLLENAKKHCDFLIVGVTSDKLSIEHKGNTPVINEIERMQIVSAIKFVDKVIPQDNYDKFQAYKKIKFDLMFVGDDWKGTERWNQLETEFDKFGVKIVYFKYTPEISSTILRKKLNLT